MTTDSQALDNRQNAIYKEQAETENALTEQYKIEQLSLPVTESSAVKLNDTVAFQSFAARLEMDTDNK